jgi:hypothetical protein
LEELRCSQARRAPFIYTEVEAGATRREFDVQRMTDELLRQPRKSRHRQAHLIVANPIHRGNLLSAYSSS